jgi:hypothetical protein
MKMIAAYVEARMNYSLHSWNEDHDRPLRVMCYLVAALSVAFCLVLVVYVILM